METYICIYAWLVGFISLFYFVVRNRKEVTSKIMEIFLFSIMEAILYKMLSPKYELNVNQCVPVPIPSNQHNHIPPWKHTFIYSIETLTLSKIIIKFSFNDLRTRMQSLKLCLASRQCYRRMCRWTIMFQLWTCSKCGASHHCLTSNGIGKREKFMFGATHFISSSMSSSKSAHMCYNVILLVIAN